MKEKINKLQTRRRRKRSDESSVISKTNIEFMKIFYRLHGFFNFITHVVNTLLLSHPASGTCLLSPRRGVMSAEVVRLRNIFNGHIA